MDGKCAPVTGGDLFPQESGKQGDQGQAGFRDRMNSIGLQLVWIQGQTRAVRDDGGSADGTCTELSQISWPRGLEASPSLRRYFGHLNLPNCSDRDKQEHQALSVRGLSADNLNDEAHTSSG